MGHRERRHDQPRLCQRALSTLDKSEHVVVAVAARALDTAEKFAKKFGIPKAYAGR